MSLGTRVAVPALLALALAAPTAPAWSQDPTPTTLDLTVRPAPQKADAGVTVAVHLTDETGEPVPGAEVRLRRHGHPDPQVLITDDRGRAELERSMSRRKEDNAWRASYAGDATYAASSDERSVRLERRASRVTVDGPASVVDERSIVLTVRWRTASGSTVSGPVRMQRRVGKGEWTAFDRLRTGRDGTVGIRVRPRVDTRYRALVQANDWASGDTSGVHVVDNLPPGTPVRLPKAAPRPRINLPDQARGSGQGAHPVTTRIPDGVWAQMTGRTYHSGCPVGRAGLRLLRINYWDYAGYRRRGELVAAASAVDNMRGALVEMYNKKLPLRSLYRADRFGWSQRLHGANDYKSMSAGNTSAFNCRGVVGNPGTRSPHSYGRSLDVNTWENPYRSAQGTVPNTWWMGHSHPRVAWRSGSHPVVAVMRRHGLRWTYGNGDTQHFDVASYARMMPAGERYAECNGMCD